MRFQLRLIPFVVTVLLCAVGISLAQWQTHRAEQKEAMALLADQQSRLPAIALTSPLPENLQVERRELALEGDFVSEWPLYLDNRPHNGVAGFYVLMPFQLKGSELHVMIVRGWQARNPNNRTNLPTLRTPSGTLQIRGVARQQLDKVLQLGTQEAYAKAAIIQNLDLKEFQTQTKLRFANFFVEQTSPVDDGLQRDWRKPIVGADKHRAYAFQWYALAIMALIFFVVTGFRRGKNKQQSN